MKEIVKTEKAPAAIGPYSQAVKAGGFMFLSGQIALDPKTMEISEEGCIACQLEQIMSNIKSILDSQGLDFSDIVKTTVFITDLHDFAHVNEVFKKYFPEDAPARSCVEVSSLPKDALVEIEAIALLK